MKKVKRALIATLIVSAISATPAFAAHEHYLVTPGHTVDNIARGQTSIGDNTHGGYHKFHENVHAGVPGTFAFQQAGKVTVGKVVVPQY